MTTEQILKNFCAKKSQHIPAGTHSPDIIYEKNSQKSALYTFYHLVLQFEMPIEKIFKNFQKSSLYTNLLYKNLPIEQIYENSQKSAL